MSHQLYTVTLTDLGTYTVTVAASSPEHAQAVAQTLLFEATPDVCIGLRCEHREAQAKAELSPSQPVKQFDVMATYSMEFFIRVPAATAEEAERHAKRIYDEEGQPFEYATGEDRVQWRFAKEVVS